MDQKIISILTLNIQTKNLEFLENLKSFLVIYRISYKVIKTTINPKSLKMSTKNETLLMEANLNNSNIYISKGFLGKLTNYSK